MTARVGFGGLVLGAALLLGGCGGGILLQLPEDGQLRPSLGSLMHRGHKYELRRVFDPEVRRAARHKAIRELAPDAAFCWAGM